MNKAAIKTAVAKDNIEWQSHALKRMMEREISRSIVKDVLLSGEIIEEYPDDKPFPLSYLS